MKMIKKKLLLLAAAGCFLISGCRSPQASAEVRSTAAKETMRQETETSNDKGGEEMEIPGECCCRGAVLYTSAL